MRTYLFSCSNVIFDMSAYGLLPQRHTPVSLLHTISSLHIGQTMRLVASAAALAPPCSSSATLVVISSVLTDKGVLLVCESRDTELSEGDRSPDVCGTGTLLGAGGGGARFLPEPSTRPPPS